MSIKDTILDSVSVAIESLSRAYMDAIRVNPLAADVPAVGELMKTAQNLRTIMLQISKLRLDPED